MSRRPLVGDRVIVVRTAGPVNFEGYTGRLTDVAPLAGEGLVVLDAGFSKWVDLDALEREERDDYYVTLEQAPKAHEVEHEGHSEHLDAIEARIPKGNLARLARATADLDANEEHVARLAPTVTQLRGMTRVTGVTDVRLTEERSRFMAWTEGEERPADRLDAIELSGEGSGTVRVGRVALVPKGGA